MTRLATTLALLVLLAPPAQGQIQVTHLGTLFGAPDYDLGEAMGGDGRYVIAGAPGRPFSMGVFSAGAVVYRRDAGAPEGYVQEAELVPGDGQAGDHAGAAVALCAFPDGSAYAAVGSPSHDLFSFEGGAVYVYHRPAAGAWAFVQKLRPFSAGSTLAGGLGTSVDVLCAETRAPPGTAHVVAGAPFDRQNGFDAGRVYTFNCTPTACVNRAELVPGAPAVGQQFGSDVSVEDTSGVDPGPGIELYLAAAARGEVGNGANGGAAYVFRSGDGGTTYTQTARIVPDDGLAGDQFGSQAVLVYDVELMQLHLHASAPMADDVGPSTGKVYTFTSANGTTWSHTETRHSVIEDTNPSAQGYQFGASLDADGDIAAAGSPSADAPDPLSGFLEAWAVVADLAQAVEVGPDGGLTPFEKFGVALAVIVELGRSGGRGGGDTAHIAVGAPGNIAGGEDAGAVYFFEVALPAPSGFDLTATNTSPLTVPPGGSVSFAYTVANNTANAATGDLWFTASPGGFSGVIRSGTLPAGATASGTYTQPVPGNAPPGTYAYRLNIGQFPSPVVDFEPFTITVTTITVTPAPRLPGAPAAWVAGEAAGWGEPLALPALPAAYPNPFADRATLRYALPEATHVRLIVYDVLGREIAVLVDGPVAAGAHEAAFDARSLPAGVYVVRLTAGARAHTQRLTLVR
jgi:hypothetical protein